MHILRPKSEAETSVCRENYFLWGVEIRFFNFFFIKTSRWKHLASNWSRRCCRTSRCCCGFWLIQLIFLKEQLTSYSLSVHLPRKILVYKIKKCKNVLKLNTMSSNVTSVRIWTFYSTYHLKYYTLHVRPR